MKCFKCGKNTRVTNSREREKMRIRQRHCDSCHYSFKTTEIVGELDLNMPLISTSVRKKNGKLERFDRNKLLESISISVRKVQREKVPLTSIVADIEDAVFSDIDGIIESRAIGELVLEKLKLYDTVAYIRYASVYREMETVEDFRHLLQDMSEND